MVQRIEVTYEKENLFHDHITRRHHHSARVHQRHKPNVRPRCAQTPCKGAEESEKADGQLRLSDAFRHAFEVARRMPQLRDGPGERTSEVLIPGES